MPFYHWWRRRESNPRPKVTWYSFLRVQPVYWRFPSRAADRQAARYGSHYAVTGRVAPLRSRSPLIDASLPTAVLRGKTGSLIRPPTQLYCCRLLFKIAGFIAGPHRYSLTIPHNPRRSLYAPVCECFILYVIYSAMSSWHGCQFCPRDTFRRQRSCIFAQKLVVLYYYTTPKEGSPCRKITRAAIGRSTG